MNSENLTALKEIIQKEKRAIKELGNLFDMKAESKKEKEMISKQTKQVQNFLRKENEKIPDVLRKISAAKQLVKQVEIPEIKIKKIQEIKKQTERNIAEDKKEIRKKFERPFLPGNKKFNLTELEKLTVNRLGERKKKEEIEGKERKPSKYIGTANKSFSETSRNLLKQDIFKTLEKNLMRANIDIAPVSYISTMIFTAIIAAGIGFVIFLFLLFFNLADFPFISFLSEPLGARFLKVFWVILVLPILTFVGMYVYPSMEKSSNENKINQELPFAAIHMATISGSLVEPSKIFSIIISTREYPFLEKEFKKLLNYVNVYGYDLVTALRNVATNTASRKLSDLLNGLATTINSGGDLSNFFNKRAQSLLFDYRLEREKYIKFSETFMDIYISAVIAAPMILMLLLMMMKVSGLGISLSGGMIALIMVLGVSAINVVFLVFLHLRQPGD
jgi:hypothetical protein